MRSNRFWIEVRNYLRGATFRRRFKSVVSILAVVTVFITTYALILPAITLENTVPMPGLVNEQTGEVSGEFLDNGETDPTNPVTPADPASFENTSEESSPSTQPTLPEELAVDGQAGGEFSDERTQYESIEGFWMDEMGAVFDANGQPIDPLALGRSQLLILQMERDERIQNQYQETLTTDGKGNYYDGDHNWVDPALLSDLTRQIIEEKYVQAVVEQFHLSESGDILDAQGNVQNPEDFSSAALLALGYKKQMAQQDQVLTDLDKEPGTHDLTLYRQLDDGNIVEVSTGQMVEKEHFSEEELAQLQEEWKQFVIKTYSINEKGEILNDQGEVLDQTLFPEDVLLALKEKVSQNSSDLEYALKLYMGDDLQIHDGYTDEVVSEAKLDELSQSLREILYDFDVNYDARLEVKDRYEALLRANQEPDDTQAVSYAESAREQAFAENQQQQEKAQTFLKAQEEEELSSLLERQAFSEQAEEPLTDGIEGNSRMNREAATSVNEGAQGMESLEGLVGVDGQNTLNSSNLDELLQLSPQIEPEAQGNPAGAPMKVAPPAGLDPNKNVLAGNQPRSYYYYTDPAHKSNSSFVRVSIRPFIGQKVPGVSYTFPTGGQTLGTLSFSNADGAYSEGTVRVYFKADAEEVGKDGTYIPPKELELWTGRDYLRFPVQKVGSSNGKGVLYYYDITGFEFGLTAQSTMTFLYPNGSLGGNTTIWAKSWPKGTTPPAASYSDAPANSEEYMNVPHVTDPRTQQVDKKGGTPSFRTLKNGETYVVGLSFMVQDMVLSGNRKYFDDIGEIPYIHTQQAPDRAVDSLKLQTGLSWRSGLAGSLGSVQRIAVTSKDGIPAGVTGVPANLTYPGSLLVATVNGQRTCVAFVEEPLAHEVNYTYALQINGANELVLTATAWYQDASREGDRTPIWNGATPLRYQIGEEIIKYAQTPQPGDQPKEITNKVEYTIHLADGNVQKSEDQVTVTLKPKTAHITIKKTARKSTAPQYFGEPAGWLITVENDSPYDYNNLEALTDTLSTYQYLSWDNLYELFNGEEQFEGQGLPTVVVENAILVTTPDQTTLINSDPKQGGAAELKKDAQTHGVNTPYNGMATSDPDADAQTATLEISKQGNSAYIVVKQNGAQVAVKDIPLDQLRDVKTKGSFDFETLGKSYIVTASSTYKLRWNYQKQGQNYVLKSGDKHSYLLTTTVKDSFMLCTRDEWKKYGSSSVTVFNDASGQFSPKAVQEDHTVDNSQASHNQARREAEIHKNHSDYKAKETGVHFFEVEMSHKGKGTPGVLTISDYIAQTDVKLLVPLEHNEDHDENDIEIIPGLEDYGAVKRSGQYVFEWKRPEPDGGGYAPAYDPVLLTGTVTIKPDGSKLIQWHFDGKTLPENFAKKISVATYRDPKAPGDPYYANQAWMNDHATHRLYDVAEILPVLDFEKNIVSNVDKNGNRVGNSDVLVSQSTLRQGDKVLYRLTIEGDAGTAVKGSDFVDWLPETPEGFLWSDDTVTFVSSSMEPASADIEVNRGAFLALKTISTDKTDGRQKLTFGQPTDTLVQFNKKGAVHLYIRLSFPDDETQWNQYAKKYEGKEIENSFELFGREKFVTHRIREVLVDEPIIFNKSAMLPRLVDYGKLSFRQTQTTIHAELTDFNKNTYKVSPTYFDYSYFNSVFATNIQFTNRSLLPKSFIVYTVTVWNGRNEDMIIKDIEDKLPAGQVFYGFLENRILRENNNPIDPYGLCDGVRIVLTYRGGTGFATYNPILSLTYKDNEIYNPTDGTKVPQDSSHVFQVSEQKEKPVFRMGKEDKVPSAGATFILPPKHMLQFSYVALVGSYDKTEEKATNVVTLRYEDNRGEGPPVLAGEEDYNLFVDKSFYKHETPPYSVNVGKSWIEPLGNDAYNLKSEVSLNRESTRMGVEKRFAGIYDPPTKTYKTFFVGNGSTIENGKYKPSEQAVWRIDCPVESGVVQDFIFKETIEKPFGFDEIKMKRYGTADKYYTFSITESTNKNYTVTLTRPSDDLLEGNAPQTQTLTLRRGQDGVFDGFGGAPSQIERPQFTVRLDDTTDGRSEITIIPGKGFFGYSSDSLYKLVARTGRSSYSPTQDIYTMRFEVKTSNHSTEPIREKRLYYNTARIIPTNPILTETVAGTYDRGNGEVGVEGGISVYDSDAIPVFGTSVTNAIKQVTRLTPDGDVYTDAQGKPSIAQSALLKGGEAYPNKIDIEKDGWVAYSLQVKNLNEVEYIDDMVIVDNLPHIGDVETWRVLQPRNSQFGMTLGVGSIVDKVKIQEYDRDGNKTNSRTLQEGLDYELEYSEKTYFERDPDFINRYDPSWGYAEHPKSLRVRLLKTEAARVQPYAVVEVTYGAFVDLKSLENTKPGDAIAWNSFGYRYHVHKEAQDDYLEAQPKPVGVILKKSGELKGRFQLTKKRVDMNGNPMPVTWKQSNEGEGMTHYFLIVNADKEYGASKETAYTRISKFIKQHENEEYPLSESDLRDVLNDNNGSDRTPNTWQLYKVTIPVGESSATIDLTPEVDEYTDKKVGLDFENGGLGNLVLLELLDTASGKPFANERIGGLYLVDWSSHLDHYEFASTPSDPSATQGFITGTNYPALFFSRRLGYTSLTTIQLTAVNKGEPWAINLLKTKGDPKSESEGGFTYVTPTPLLGAVFGLYSPLEEEEMSAAEARNIQTRLNLPTPLQTKFFDPKSQKPFYLKAVSDGSSLGVSQDYNPRPDYFTLTGDGFKDGINQTQVDYNRGLRPTARFENLTADRYILLEIKAPDGFEIASREPIYMDRRTYYASRQEDIPSRQYGGYSTKAILETDYRPLRNEDSWALVYNPGTERKDVLPTTGGQGILPNIIGGLALMLTTGLIIWKRRKARAFNP